MNDDLRALTADERELIRTLLFEYRRHVLPSELAELDRVRVLLNKVSELEPVP